MVLSFPPIIVVCKKAQATLGLLISIIFLNYMLCLQLFVLLCLTPGQFKWLTTGMLPEVSDLNVKQQEGQKPTLKPLVQNILLQIWLNP